MPLNEEFNYPLPLPLSEEELRLISSVEEQGWLIASPETDRHEALVNLRDRGILFSMNCPEALGVDQFMLSSRASEIIEAL